MTPTSFGVPTEADRAALAPILAHCFGFPVEETPDWFSRAGFENVRVLRRDGHVIGGLLTVPMGQHFGGRAVPMLGIAGVGIRPDARGSGVATTLMTETLRDARRNGHALSTLYPATVPLYRGVGYARAGARYEVRIAPSAAATRSRKLPLVRIESGDDPDVAATYARFAARRDGFLARGPYVWGRIFRPRKGAVEGFKAIGANGCEGYVVIKHQMGDGAASEVMVNDFVANTREAAERLLDLLAGYGSVATGIRWYGGAPDLLTSALPERRHDIRVTDFWMLRVVDVERALTMRGYRGSGSLSFELADDVLPENSGRFVLHVKDARATVERGGDGALRLDVRGLAALYTGFHDARTLVELGEIAGQDEVLAHADAIFAGRAPSMCDFF